MNSTVYTHIRSWIGVDLQLHNPLLAYHIVSYYILLYHIISDHTPPYHIISSHIISHHIVSYIMKVTEQVEQQLNSSEVVDGLVVEQLMDQQWSSIFVSSRVVYMISYPQTQLKTMESLRVGSSEVMMASWLVVEQQKIQQWSSREFSSGVVDNLVVEQ